MRIAMLGHKRMPSREGGVEIVVEELSVRMAAQGHRVTCYNRSGHHVSGKEFNTEKQKAYRDVRLITVPAIDVKGIVDYFSGTYQIKVFTAKDIIIIE